MSVVLKSSVTATPGGSSPGQPFETGADGVGGLHGVLAALLLDDQLNCGLAVHVYQTALVPVALENIGYVAQADLAGRLHAPGRVVSAALVGDHRVADLPDGLVLAGGGEEVVQIPVHDGAGRHLDVLPAKHAHDLVDRQAVGLQALEGHLHADHPLTAARHAGHRHARDLLDARLNRLFRDLPELLRTSVP